MSFRFDLDTIDRRRLVPGLILIGIGLLGLLGTLGWFGGPRGLPGALLFGAVAYFAHIRGTRTGSRLWRLAAYPLAGLAIAAIAPGSLGGFAFLGSIGLAFALVYRENPEQWWAVIPAGALFSLAATALVDGMTRGPNAGGSIFFLGLAATFFVLTRLPRHPQSWGIYPAAALAVLAIVGPASGGGWTVPLLLIAIGAWLLLRPDLARRADPAAGHGPAAANGPDTGGGPIAANGSAAPSGSVASPAPAATTAPASQAGAVAPAPATVPGTVTPVQPEQGATSERRAPAPAEPTTGSADGEQPR
jgi:hypothetical protein